MLCRYSMMASTSCEPTPSENGGPRCLQLHRSLEAVLQTTPGRTVSHLHSSRRLRSICLQAFRMAIANKINATAMSANRAKVCIYLRLGRRLRVPPAPAATETKSAKVSEPLTPPPTRACTHKSRWQTAVGQCPLSPQKRTFVSSLGMSALCQ